MTWPMTRTDRQTPGERGIIAGSSLWATELASLITLRTTHCGRLGGVELPHSGPVDQRVSDSLKLPLFHRLESLRHGTH